MSVSHNKRKYARAPLSTRLTAYQWNRPLPAEAGEISGNGIFLKTSSSVPEGTLLTLRIGLPGDARPFTVLGKVVRTVHGGRLRSSGLGVSFVDIAAGDKRAVLEYVTRRTVKVL